MTITTSTANVYYATKATADISAGTYSNIVRYTAYAEEPDFSMEYMQEFTAEMCNELAETTTSKDNRLELHDIRDGKAYKIAKLADGNCWMVQNLALDGGITLHPGNSNVTTSRSLNPNIPSGVTDSVDTTDQIFSGIATDTTKTTSGHALASDEPYGNLYNFMAATAGVGDENSTGTVTESICPKGWRLPDNTGDKSWSNLMSVYGYPTESSRSSANYAYIEAVQKAPFYMPLAGDFYGAPYTQGDRIHLWTRTVSDTVSNVYHFGSIASTGFFAPSNSAGKLLGFSVRCVLGG